MCPRQEALARFVAGSEHWSLGVPRRDSVYCMLPYSFSSSSLYSGCIVRWVKEAAEKQVFVVFTWALRAETSISLQLFYRIVRKIIIKFQMLKLREKGKHSYYSIAF